jgi:tetratricopeptide (TPR) repeat protein
LLRNWFLQQNVYANFEIVEIKPFTVVEIQSYLKAVFGQIEISEQEVNYIHKITNGNPYYLNEVVRLLVQAGKIRLIRSLWHCESLEKLTLPTTIGTALSYKIEKCSEEIRNLLSQASVLGTSFSFDLLIKLTEIEEQDLEKLLLEAEKEHLVYEDRNSRQDEYYFQSSALQEILYDSLGKRQKKRLHLRAAVAIKEIYFNKLKQAFSTLAYHYQMAGEGAEAFYFAHQAVLILFEQGTWDEVVKLGQLVEEITFSLKESDSLEEIDLAQLVELKNKYVNALVNLGKLEQALSQAHLTLEIAEKLSNQELIAQTYTTMAHLGWFQGRFVNIITWAEKGLVAALQADNKFWQQQLHLQIGRAKLRCAPYKEALEHFVRACELAEEIKEEKLLAQAQAFRGVNLFLLGKRQEGFNYINQALDLTRNLKDSVFESRIYSIISLMASCEYNFDLLKQMHEKGSKLAQKIGWRIGEIYQDTILAGSYLVDINLDTEKAEYLLQRALALALEVGDKATELVIRRGLAQLSVLTGTGDCEVASNQIQQLAATLKNFGELLEQTLTLRILAEIQELSGQTKSALDSYYEALEVAQYAGAIHQEWVILLGQARCLYKQENFPEALEKLKLGQKIVEFLRSEIDPDKYGKYFYKATQNIYELKTHIESQVGKLT